MTTSGRYPAPGDATISDRMRRNPRRDTKPELQIRRILHRAGFRFRVDHSIRATNVLVRPDVVFTRQRVAVFIDGCFWHSCPEHGTTPRRNADYWVPKLRNNRVRDARVDASLADAGWAIVRIWEHEPATVAAARVIDVVRKERERSDS